MKAIKKGHGSSDDSLMAAAGGYLMHGMDEKAQNALQKFLSVNFNVLDAGSSDQFEADTIEFSDDELSDLVSPEHIDLKASALTACTSCSGSRCQCSASVDHLVS